MTENQNTIDPKRRAEILARASGNDTHALPNHCATCGHYREWHRCLVGGVSKPRKAADIACHLYTTERASDMIDDGYGIRARGGLVYFG